MSMLIIRSFKMMSKINIITVPIIIIYSFIQTLSQLQFTDTLNTIINNL